MTRIIRVNHKFGVLAVNLNDLLNKAKIWRNFNAMNTLSYNTNTEDYLTFELLIDGKLLSEVIYSADTHIPYWIIEDNLPYFPPHSPEFRQNQNFIISACDGCGEYGCGNTHCKIVQEGDEVVFSDFSGDLPPESKEKEFRFSIENYNLVVSEIVEQAKKEQAKDEKRTNNVA